MEGVKLKTLPPPRPTFYRSRTFGRRRRHKEILQKEAEGGMRSQERIRMPGATSRPFENHHGVFSKQRKPRPEAVFYSSQQVVQRVQQPVDHGCAASPADLSDHDVGQKAGHGIALYADRTPAGLSANLESSLKSQQQVVLVYDRLSRTPLLDGAVHRRNRFPEILDQNDRPILLRYPEQFSDRKGLHFRVKDVDETSAGVNHVKLPVRERKATSIGSSQPV